MPTHKNELPSIEYLTNEAALETAKAFQDEIDSPRNQESPWASSLNKISTRLTTTDFSKVTAYYMGNVFHIEANDNDGRWVSCDMEKDSLHDTLTRIKFLTEETVGFQPTAYMFNTEFNDITTVSADRLDVIQTHSILSPKEQRTFNEVVINETKTAFVTRWGKYINHTKLDKICDQEHVVVMDFEDLNTFRAEYMQSEELPRILGTYSPRLDMILMANKDPRHMISTKGIFAHEVAHLLGSHYIPEILHECIAEYIQEEITGEVSISWCHIRAEYFRELVKKYGENDLMEMFFSTLDHQFLNIRIEELFERIQSQEVTERLKPKWTESVHATDKIPESHTDRLATMGVLVNSQFSVFSNS